MMDYTRNHFTATKTVAYDKGLREYMIKVFNYMFVALAITGLSSFITMAATPIKYLFFAQTATGYGLSGLGWVFAVAPLLFVFYFSYKLNTISAAKAKTLLWVFSILMGISLAPIFMLYTGTSIARVFFITSSVFAAMSIYGYTTKKDLTNWRSFLVMGLIGGIIASLVNVFMQSPAIHFVTSLIFVVIFTGFTAYDVQNIVRVYQNTSRGDVQDKAAVVGALSLYLDFINLFVSLLRLFGDRRS